MGRHGPPDARTARPAGTVGAVLIALALTACGAPGTSGPASAPSAPPVTAPTTAAPSTATAAAQDWAGAVCGGVQPVLDTLADPPAPSVGDPAGTRQAYLNYLASAAQQADQALERLAAAGTPPVSDGDRIAGQVREQLTQMRTDIEQARAHLEQADPNDVASLVEAVASTGNVLGSLGNSAQALVAISNDPQLGPAFDQAPACASLRNVG